jgi:hypothetical protein
MGDCPFQNKQHEIQEARCIIPLIRPKESHDKVVPRNSWFCDFYDKEERCPIMERLVEFSLEEYEDG